MIASEKNSVAFQLILVTFTLLVVFANMFSAKMVYLSWAHLNIPAGLLIYPLSFILSDLMTEIYGKKKAKEMVFIAFMVNLFASMLFWVVLKMPTQNNEVQNALEIVLGLSFMRIISSLIAFVISQTVGVGIYSFLKVKTKNKLLWLRIHFSAWVVLLIDTLIIDILFFHLGLKMNILAVVPIMVFSFLYKMIFSLINVPIVYGILKLYALKNKNGVLT